MWEGLQHGVQNREGGGAAPDGGGLAGAYDKVLWLLLLQHEPHAVHVVARMAPVTLGIQVAQKQALLGIRATLLRPGES